MQGCVHIGDEALYQLVRRCSRLQLVNLHGCRNVQDDGVMELAENSPALRYPQLLNVCQLRIKHSSKYLMRLKERSEVKWVVAVSR